MNTFENIPKEQLVYHSNDNMLLFTAVLATIIGLILTWLGKKGKQQWMVVWSIGLIFCSLAMGTAVFLGK